MDYLEFGVFFFFLISKIVGMVDWSLNVVGKSFPNLLPLFLKQPILTVLHSSKAWQEGSPKHSEKDAESHFMPQILPWTN